MTGCSKIWNKASVGSIHKDRASPSGLILQLGIEGLYLLLENKENSFLPPSFCLKEWTSTRPSPLNQDRSHSKDDCCSITTI